MRRLLACLALLTLPVAACGSETAPTPDAFGDAGTDGALDGGTDAAVDGAADSATDASTDSGADAARDGAADSATDASMDSGADGSADGSVDGSADASVDLPCLGERRPLVLSRHLPYTVVTVGGGAAPPSGLFLLDLATTGSAVDLTALSPRPAASGCDPSLLWQRCGFSDLDFFGSWGPVTLTTQDLSGLGGVTEAGILGTDFFAVVALFFDYDGAQVRRAFADTLCDDGSLVAAGFAPLSTDGFYASDLARLRPMTDVDATAPSFAQVPNVPTVPIRLAATDAVAQLDTGFDDSLAPNALNVNVALFDAIMAASPGALTRDPGGDLALTTCVVGVTENVDAYTLSPGRSLEFVTTDGGAARSLTDVRVFVKNTPAAAHVCGGIGTWTVPAAQTAASLHATLGQLLVDPFSSRVWIPRR